MVLRECLETSPDQVCHVSAVPRYIFDLYQYFKKKLHFFILRKFSSSSSSTDAQQQADGFFGLLFKVAHLFFPNSKKQSAKTLNKVLEVGFPKELNHY